MYDRYPESLSSRPLLDVAKMMCLSARMHPHRVSQTLLHDDLCIILAECGAWPVDALHHSCRCTSSKATITWAIWRVASGSWKDGDGRHPPRPKNISKRYQTMLLNTSDGWPHHTYLPFLASRMEIWCFYYINFMVSARLTVIFWV